MSIQYVHVKRPRGKRDEIILTARYSAIIAGNKLTIPVIGENDDRKGFICDGGTIFRAFWSILGITPFGRFRECFVRHDYRWAFRGKLNTSFAESNAQLIDEMRYVGGAKPWQLSAIKWAVTWPGLAIWIKGYANADNVEYHYGRIADHVDTH